MTAAFEIQVEPAPAQRGEDYILLARCTCPSRTGSIRMMVPGELLLDVDPVTVREVIARECRSLVNEPELQVLSARAILVGDPE